MRTPLCVVSMLVALAGPAGAEPASAAVAPAPLAADAGPVGEQEARPRLWTWIAAGGAAALALSGLVVGLNAQDTFDELEQRCAPACARSDADAVDRRAVAADILLGSAAAVAAAAVILYLVEARAPAAKNITPVAGPGVVGLGAALEY